MLLLAARTIAGETCLSADVDVDATALQDHALRTWSASVFGLLAV